MKNGWWMRRWAVINHIKIKWQNSCSPSFSKLFNNNPSSVRMAAFRSLLSIALLALLFIFSESIPTSNSLTGIPRRDVFQTAAHWITKSSVIESSSLRKSNNFHIEARRRIRPVLIGSNHPKSAANWSRVASFEVGSVLSICIFLGLFFWM